MLGRLCLKDFRCFEWLELEVPAGGGVFTGANAQGKTSILEAVCVLMRLQSPRAKRMGPMIRFGEKGWGLSGEVGGRCLRVEYGVGGLGMGVDGEGVEQQGKFLEESGLVVWFGNEDLQLVRGGGEVRRRYLDFLCAQVSVGYRRALVRYKRALKAKNLLLKMAVLDEGQLGAYEALMVEYGEEVMGTRGRILRELMPYAVGAQKLISGRYEPLEIRYQCGGGVSGDLADAMLQARGRERQLRQAIVGPHRDDFLLFLHGMPAGEFASEGQQRTLALALKLAQGDLLREVMGRFPIYLLDDIFGELDPQRRNALMGGLPVEAQKWITTTSMDWLADGVGKMGEMGRWAVEQGRVVVG